ncbi:pyridoxamine 5'-phosphate oxidase family protein [Oryzicola mucosus]|uniref:Pyridoxamine 5'-phosphate oxidase family protein n=1 Tax=Oryzicola mucosus TaxID=2767425 RepID=A0A8J6PSU0_9HYPH|nr:pyridoxamine 5'-phosphate oxidase family protein [Oryzicola mucosus]MBD0413461.1 pyridoxamine 5'-phosphate oxidase family protein [Oryzicola mucosus]
MTSMTLSELSKKMSSIDFCMLSTKASDGEIASRPMSNNGDVEYDGDTWFFTYEDTKKVREIESDNSVSLTFSGSKSLLGAPGIFIAIEGDADLIRDKAQFEEHWVKDLEIWFPDGIDTPGIALIKVHATKISYWDGEDSGTVAI